MVQQTSKHGQLGHVPMTYFLQLPLNDSCLTLKIYYYYSIITM